METIDKPTLKTLIAQTKGRFFSIIFRKADGTIRVANGKDYYKKLLHGGQSTHQKSKSCAFVDRNKVDFISANAERIIAFKCGSVVYPKKG